MKWFMVSCLFFLVSACDMPNDGYGRRDHYGYNGRYQSPPPRARIEHRHPSRYHQQGYQYNREQHQHMDAPAAHSQVVPQPPPRPSNYHGHDEENRQQHGRDIAPDYSAPTNAVQNNVHGHE